MKITKLETLRIEERPNLFWIHVHTDEGLIGLGETFLLASGGGVSPWTVLAEGLSIYTTYSIGWCTFWVSLFVLILWITRFSLLINVLQSVMKILMLIF